MAKKKPTKQEASAKAKKDALKKASRRKTVEVERALTKGSKDPAVRTALKKALSKAPTTKRFSEVRDQLAVPARETEPGKFAANLVQPDGTEREPTVAEAADEAVAVAGADPNEMQPCFLCEPNTVGERPTGAPAVVMVKRSEGYCFGCGKFICDAHQGNTAMGTHDPEEHEGTEEELPEEGFEADGKEAESTED